MTREDNKEEKHNQTHTQTYLTIRAVLFVAVAVQVFLSLRRAKLKKLLLFHLRGGEPSEHFEKVATRNAVDIKMATEQLPNSHSLGEFAVFSAWSREKERGGEHRGRHTWCEDTATCFNTDSKNLRIYNKG